jgi:RNA polymerase sigma-70 factor (ECF subfamily)
VVNVSINHYRKKTKEKTVSTDDEITYEEVIPESVFSELTSKELINLIQLLPEGYRIVFNLYAIEGYKHNEIADMMGYTESTSKTQFMKAKKMLQRFVFKLYPKIAEAYTNSDKDKKLIFDF